MARRPGEGVPARDEQAALALELSPREALHLPLHPLHHRVHPLLQLLHLRPLLPITGATQRQDDTTVGILGLHDDRDHVLPDPELLRSRLAQRDHSCGTITEIDRGLISAHARDRSFDGLTHPERS